MARHVVNLAAGLCAAAVGSAVLSLGISATAGSLRHPFESFPWLWAVSAVPTSAVTIVAGLIPARGRPRRGQLWASAVVAALLVVALSGSVGAITVESLRRGISGVNVAGYLQWCGLYAVLLLPLSLPLALWVVWFAWRQNG